MIKQIYIFIIFISFCSLNFGGDNHSYKKEAELIVDYLDSLNSINKIKYEERMLFSFINGKYYYVIVMGKRFRATC